MSTRNNATPGQIYGGWKRESNDTVLFTSEQARRIRFRYTGTSLHYPSAAIYQCTQCPVTALMINAEFRIVDPCAGHDCSTDACHPQWTPSTDDATTVVSAQRAPAATVPESRSTSPAKNAMDVIAKATYDENGWVTWPSERYTGTIFTFRPNTYMSGRRRYFYCPDCARKCDKYKSSLKACGISRRHLIVSGDDIVDCHPDDVGTNQGHLCQQPLLEEKLKKAKVTGEPAANFGNAREGALANQLSAESYVDKPFGKALAVQWRTLTEAEYWAWSDAPAINAGRMRDKELIMFRSQEHQRRFKFVLAGPSPLDEYAFDYYCLECWIKHREECRVTVRSRTQEFIITDPDLTSSGRHACTQAPSAHHTGSPASAKNPRSDLEGAQAERLRVETENLPLVEAPAKSMEYVSERYQDKLKFVLINKGLKGQAYYACLKCRTMQRKLKEEGYRRFGYTECRLHHAIVVGSQFVQRHPDECGAEIAIGGTVERRHICHDDKLKELLDVDGATCGDRGEPSSKCMRDATYGSQSGSAVFTSIHTQSVNGPQVGTHQRDDSNRIPIDQRADEQANLPHPKNSAIDQAAMEPATATRNDESSCHSEGLDLGPAVGALDASPQHAESIDSVSSAAQYAISQREREANTATAHLDVEEEQKPLRFDERRESANADDRNHPTSSSSKANKTSRFAGSATTSGTRKRFAGSSVEDKSPTKKSPEMVTIDDSDEDTDANGASKTSKKQVKREPIENNDAERDRDPAAKFHLFIRECDLVDEYARYSVYNSGEPTAFVKQRHVMEKWIKFNQRY